MKKDPGPLAAYDRLIASLAQPSTVDVLGAQLHEGDVVVEHLPGGGNVLHLIHHFADYRGRFVGAGDHARRAYDAGGQWCATIADRERFHVLAEHEG